MSFIKDARHLMCAPSFGHDADADYSVGSFAYDSLNGVTYVCTDNTPDLALWHPIVIPKAIPSRSYFGPDQVIGIADSSNIAANQLTFQPIIISQRMAVDRAALVLVTAGSAGAKARLMLYNSRYGLPSTLRKDFGEVALDGATGLVPAVSSTTLDPGLYFLAAMLFSVTTMPVLKRVSQVATFGTPQFNATSLTSGNAARGLILAQAYGAAPTSISAEPAETNGGDVPLITLRRG